MLRLLVVVSAVLLCSTANTKEDPEPMAVGTWSPIWHEVDSVAVLTLWNGVAPDLFVRPFPARPYAEKKGQELKTSWVDREGVNHEVVTDVPPTTDTAKYVKRHDKLVQLLKVMYPPAPPGPQKPQLGGNGGLVNLPGSGVKEEPVPVTVDDRRRELLRCGPWKLSK